MNHPSDAERRPRRLLEAVREVKNRAADRDDVVVELREASRTRLELLLAELEPIIAEIPEDMDIFDFSVSAGLQPRLWIDTTAHVALGRDRRTYRFLRDTRAGRIVMAESVAMPPIVEAVTRYVAERIVERERALSGEWVATTALPPAEAQATPAAAMPARPRRPGWKAALTGALAAVGLGALAGLALSLYLFWDRVVAAFQVLSA